jgi:hypothetical protein
MKKLLRDLVRQSDQMLSDERRTTTSQKNAELPAVLLEMFFRLEFRDQRIEMNPLILSIY